MSYPTKILRDLLEHRAQSGGAEIYWDTAAWMDFDTPAEAWDWVEENADAAEAALMDAAKRHATLLGGLRPPASFVEFARELGYVDVFGTPHPALLYSFSWLASSFGDARLSEFVFDIDAEFVARHADGSRLAGMCLPDNPGDMPAYCLLAAFEHRTAPDECLWLYAGLDAGFGGGIRLAPIGATFHEASAALLTGVASALMFPPDKGAQALAQLSEVCGASDDHRALVLQVLAGLRDLCGACADVEVVTGESGVDTAPLGAEIGRLRERIRRVERRLGSTSALPFGRSPAVLSLQRSQGRSRGEVFDAEHPDVAALLEAVDQGDLAAVRRLLDRGVDPSVRDEEGDTPLHRVALSSTDSAQAIGELLIEHGADPNVHGRWGLTPLHRVVTNRAVDLTARLIEAGADVDALDHNGGPPLFGAITNSRVALVERLLDAGADPNIESDLGHTALSLADGKSEIQALLRAFGATD